MSNFADQIWLWSFKTIIHLSFGLLYSGKRVELSHSSHVWFCNIMDCSPPSSSVHEDSPGKNIGGGCHALLQGISPTQGSNLGILHFRRILYRLSHHGSPLIAMLPGIYFMVFTRYPTSRTTLNRLSLPYVEHSSFSLCPLKAFSPFIFWHKYSLLGTFLNS